MDWLHNTIGGMADMKRNTRPPASWKLEEYAFGAAALREEIKRHKREDKLPWNPIKAIWVRLLYIYLLVAAFVLTMILMLVQKSNRVSKKKEGRD